MRCDRCDLADCTFCYCVSTCLSYLLQKQKMLTCILGNCQDPVQPRGPWTVRSGHWLAFPVILPRTSRYPLPFLFVTSQIPLSVVYRYYSDPRSDSDVHACWTYVSDWKLILGPPPGHSLRVSFIVSGSKYSTVHYPVLHKVATPSI